MRSTLLSLESTCISQRPESKIFDSLLRSKQKQKAGRLANAELIFAFAQLRDKGTQIDPHGLRRKPKMPKIINLGNCVKLLCSLRFERNLSI